MDQLQKDKLLTNIKASPRMLSVQAIAGVSAAASAVLGWFLQLAPDAQERLLQGVLSHYAWGVTALPILTGALAYYARVHPQSNITPTEASAKSAEAPAAVQGASAPSPEARPPVDRD